MTTAPARSTRRPARGFTFVELIAASAVFLAGLGGLIALHHTSANQLAAAQHQVVANAVGANILELCQLLPIATFTTLAGGSTSGYDIYGSPVGTGGVGAGPAFFTAVASTQPTVSSALTNLRVVVRWQEPSSGQSRTVSAETWVTPPST